MKLFMVDIEKTTSSIKTFMIQAENGEEAMIKAKDNSKRTNWGRSESVSYSALSAEEKE